MKTAILIILLLCAQNAKAVGLPVWDPEAIIMSASNLAQSIKRNVTQVQQWYNAIDRLKNQIKGLENQAKNLANLGNMDWQDLGKLASNLNNVYYSTQALTYKAGQTSKTIDNIFGSTDKYVSQFGGANSTYKKSQSYTESYQKLLDQNRNEVKGSLEVLSQQFENINKDNSELQRLKGKASDTGGNLAALQAIANLIAYQTDEIRKLRLIAMSQLKFLSTIEMSKSAKAELEQARKQTVLDPPPPHKKPVKSTGKERL